LKNETKIKYETTTRYQIEILQFSYKSHTNHVGESQFLHHWCIEFFATEIVIAMDQPTLAKAS